MFTMLDLVIALVKLIGFMLGVAAGWVVLFRIASHGVIERLGFVARLALWIAAYFLACATAGLIIGLVWPECPDWFIEAIVQTLLVAVGVLCACSECGLITKDTLRQLAGVQEGSST
jgi:hypothetical protein